MLWKVALFLPVLAAASSGPKYFISAPNVIRVGVNETIVINILNADNVPVTVELQDAARSKTYDSKTVHVRRNDPTSITLQVSPQDVDADDGSLGDPQYVYLHATASQRGGLQFDKGTPILLSYKAGYAFLQTDKPIYTPNQKVFIRLVAVNQQMRPSNEKVRVDIITPQGMIVKRFMVKPEAGFAHAEYKFPVSPAFGNWTAAAYYGYKMTHNTTVQFLVKEYVLPTYSVNITVQSTPYILSTQAEIRTLVSGEYVFGDKRIQGFYHIKYRLMDHDGSLQLIKDNITGVLKYGKVTDTLSLSDILGDQDFDEFLGKRLHIEAFIVERATDKIESRNNTILQFVDTPYKIRWDQTRKYFKIGHPFKVQADVVYCYGDPVDRLNVNAVAVGHLRGGDQTTLYNNTKTSNDQGRVIFHLNLKTMNEIQEIVVEMTTDNFELTDTFTALPFNAGGENTLLISPVIDSDGNAASVTFGRNGGNDEDVDVIFTYVVAGGKISQAQAVDRVIGGGTVTEIRITPDMAPSARIVAFYVNADNQLVADAVLIDVDEKCENPVEISVPRGKNGESYYLPGETATLTLTGKPHTKIALLAVDNAVYLLQNYHRLNQKKVFARMASYDLGCGPGGGGDIQDTFKNAGIVILTNAGLQTQLRNDLSCDDHHRKRRSASEVVYNIQDLRIEYAGNSSLAAYCERGTILLEDYSCARRARGLANRKNLDVDHPYVQALKKCCMAVSQATGRTLDSNPPVPGIGTIDYAKANIRSDFKESWLFEDRLVDLGAGDSTTHDIRLPGSITTWIIQAVGVSPLHGMCVADNKEIVARRDFFLDVSLPYSVMRREQVALQATVYNFKRRRNQNLRFELHMKGIEGLCSNARPNEFEILRGTVAEGSAQSFTFIVIPLEVKDFDITIYLFSNFGEDAVQKKLHVVPEGAPQVQPLSLVLDPAGIGHLLPQSDIIENIDHGISNNLKHSRLLKTAELTQTDTVILEIPENAVPHTANCEVSLIGDVLGPIPSAVISGLPAAAAKLLQVPSGCGEQNMMKVAPNVYIYKYLKSINKVTSEVEDKATQHIEDGYALQTQSYSNPNGSFSLYKDYPEHSWLTAFVLRVFCEARKVTNSFIDEENVICKGMSWLSGIQGADGSFRSTYQSSIRIKGLVTEPIAMTAYVLLTFSECACANVDTSEAVRKATTYLENKLPDITESPQTLAIVTYALALVNSSRAIEANTQLRTLAHHNPGQGTMYFGPEEGGAVTVETTAYVLLAQIILDEIPYSYPIVQWLMLQRDQIGFWYSTQDTMVALQALAEFAERTYVGDIDMTCEAHSTEDRYFNQSWHVLPENSLVLQGAEARLPVEGELVFETHGVGIATLSVNLRYHTASGNQSLCPFEITITSTDKDPVPLSPGAPASETPKNRLNIEVCARNTGQGPTNMAIIDVGLISGFKPIDETVTKAREDTQLIGRTDITDNSVIFYADKIPSVDPLCVTFEAEQEHAVGNVQPVPVHVYDYYQPERKCVEFYKPGPGSPVLPTICEGYACQCAAASCGNNVTDLSIKALELKMLSCQSAEHFAYKIRCLAKSSRSESKTFDMFTVSAEVLKAGKENGVQNAVFWKSVNCDHPVIEEGNDYLIIGNGGIPVRNDQGVIIKYKYYMDSGFKVIHWPSVSQLEQATRECRARSNPCERPCKRKCYRDHRKPWEDYFNEVMEEFESGCLS